MSNSIQRQIGSAFSESQEERKLDEAIKGADDLLMNSLEQEERRRRRRRGRWWALITGTLVMITILFTVFAFNLNAVAGNLLQNQSVEEGNGAPAHWSQGANVPGVKYIWDKNAAKEGKSSLCLDKSANRYFPIAQWFQTVEHKSDQSSIRVSAQVKADKVTKAVIDVLFLDGSDDWIKHEWVAYIGPKQSGAAPFTHDWKPYSGSVKIPPGTRKIQVGLQVYGPGKVWFDDVRAEYGE